MVQAKVDPDQEKYLEKLGMGKCGSITKEGKTDEKKCQLGSSAHKTNGRIINGITCGKFYPWMVGIHRGNKQAHSALKVPRYTTGSIVTDKAIITCGHCICNEQKPSKLNNYMTVTCPQNPTEINDNLNKIGLNEITVVLNTPVLPKAKHNWPFDENLEAFLYKYEKDEKFFSKNGDLGLLFKNRGFAPKSNLVPICLPSPDTYDESNEIRVKLAGWGLQYDREKEVGKEKSSCQTNEGVIIDGKEPLPPFEDRSVFLECKFKDPGKAACFNVLNENKINTFSTSTDMTKIVKAVTKEDQTKAFENILQSISFKSCNKYLEVAKDTWIKEMKESNKLDTKDSNLLLSIFNKKISRIEIWDEKSKIETCYNVANLGKFGICETTDKSAVSWGFCSKTCHIMTLKNFQNVPLNEAEFIYYDEMKWTKASYLQGKKYA